MSPGSGRGKYGRLVSERRADCRRAEDATVSRVIAEFWGHAKRYYARPETDRGGVRGSEADIPFRRLYGAIVAAEFGPECLLV